MFRNVKLAAVMLVLVLLSAPLFAAVTCVAGFSPAVMHCPACKKMADSSFGVHRDSGSCCDLSQAKLAPTAVLQSPVTVASAAPQNSIAMPGLMPAAFRTSQRQSHALRMAESPQSLLCTFLI